MITVKCMLSFKSICLYRAFFNEIIISIRCASTYYGNPLIIGSTCKPCDCNGAPCDNLTGQCINCLGNTVGWNCKECKPGHFGNPIVSDCRRK